MVRLGVNIDHVATLRNARGGVHPDPVEVAKLAEAAGADGITAHLREDRRHIRDEDMRRLKEQLTIPLNMEMAATAEMQKIALEIQPHAICLVPEKREEVTTEGGLDALASKSYLTEYIQKVKDGSSKVTLFLDPDFAQIEAAAHIGADQVEIHTGRFCLLQGEEQEKELAQIAEAAAYVTKLGMECHAGHGLDYATTKKIITIPQIKELNIGHFMIGQSVSEGIERVIQRMKKVILS